MINELVFLKFFNSTTEAELAKNLLEIQGIITIINKKGVEFPGDMGDSYGADLLVSEKDFKKAKIILNILDEKSSVQIVKEKKTSEEWKIALIYFGIAYMAIPFGLSFIFSLIIYILGARLSNIDLIFQQWSQYGIGIVWMIFLTWLGVFIASWYLLKNYNIANDKKVISLATAYVVFAIILLNFGIIVLQQINDVNTYIY